MHDHSFGDECIGPVQANAVVKEVVEPGLAGSQQLDCFFFACQVNSDVTARHMWSVLSWHSMEALLRLSPLQICLTSSECVLLTLCRGRSFGLLCHSDS